MEAIRAVKGFDPRVKGAQEDVDASYRLSTAGWNFYITSAVLFERQRRTWKALWKQHNWYGYGLHFVQHKNKGKNIFSAKSVDRIILSFQAYRLTHKKIVFLLPLNFIFKKAALLAGYIMAHLNGYGHETNKERP